MESNLQRVRPKQTEAADQCIRRYVTGAVGAGFIYSPMINALAIATLEVSMITEMAHIYKFPVPHKLVIYKVLISLAFGIGPVYFSARVLTAASGFDFLGYAAQVLLMGSTGSVSVYAVGKVFQKHYESGGTFLSSKNAILTGYYKEQYAEGKTVVPAYLANKTT